MRGQDNWQVTLKGREDCSTEGMTRLDEAKLVARQDS